MAVVIDGSTGVSKVQDGAITVANLPSGAVIQTLHSTAGVSTITHTSTYADVISGSITPTAVGNKIIAIASLNFFVLAASTSYYGYGQYIWNKDGVDVGTAYQMYVANTGGHRQSQQNTFSYEWTVGAGEAGIATTIKVRGKKEANTDATFLSNNYSPSHIILMEIAQ